MGLFKLRRTQIENRDPPNAGFLEYSVCLGVSQEREQIGLCDGFIADLAPALKSKIDKIDESQNFAAIPVLCTVVIRDAPLLLRYKERIRHAVQMVQSIQFRAECGRRVGVYEPAAIGSLLLGSRSHLAVFKEPCQQRPLIDFFPIKRGV